MSTPLPSTFKRTANKALCIHHMNFLNVYICLSLSDGEVVHRPGAYRPMQRRKQLTAGVQYGAQDWTGVYHTGSRPISFNAKWHAAKDWLSFFRNIGYSGAELSIFAIEIILYAGCITVSCGAVKRHSFPEMNHGVRSQPHFFFISSISHFMELHIGMILEIWGQNIFLFRDSMFTHCKHKPDWTANRNMSQWKISHSPH